MVLKRLWRFFKKSLLFKKSSRKPRKRRAREKKHRVRRHIPRPSRTRKKPPKRVRKVSASKKPSIKAIPAGVITHYFPKVNAAVVKLSKPLNIGEPVWIKGRATDFRQTVGSMQVDRSPIEKGRAGQEIGLEVFREVKPGDRLFILKG